MMKRIVQIVMTKIAIVIKTVALHVSGMEKEELDTLVFTINVG